MKEEKLKYEKVNNIKPAMRIDGKPDLCSGCDGRLARTIEQENMDVYAMSFDRGCPDCGQFMSFIVTCKVQKLLHILIVRCLYLSRLSSLRVMFLP